MAVTTMKQIEEEGGVEIYHESPSLIPETLEAAEIELDEIMTNRRIRNQSFCGGEQLPPCYEIFHNSTPTVSIDDFLSERSIINNDWYFRCGVYFFFLFILIIILIILCIIVFQLKKLQTILSANTRAREEGTMHPDIPAFVTLREILDKKGCGNAKLD